MIEMEDQEKEEAKASAVPVDPRKNVKPKKVIRVAKDGKPGDIAHYHKREDEHYTWDEPCYFVEYKVRNRAGLRINEHDYIGKVVVPQCTADYLAWRDSLKADYEKGIYRSNRINKTVASL